MENINKAIDARLPGSITNPTRGGLWKGLGRRFGGTPPPQADTAIPGLGDRPAPGERAMTREQWKAEDRARRIAQRPGLETRGYRPKPGERAMTKEQWKARYRAERIAKRPGLETRGYRPKPGERAMTKEQWKARSRAERIAKRPGLETRGYRPKPGERAMTREQWGELSGLSVWLKILESLQKKVFSALPISGVSSI